MSALTTIHDEGDGLNTWWPTLTDEVIMTTSNFSCAGTDRLVTPQSAFLAFFFALSCMCFCICLIQQISFVSSWIMPLWRWYCSSWHSEPTKSHCYLASNLISLSTLVTRFSRYNIVWCCFSSFHGRSVDGGLRFLTASHHHLPSNLDKLKNAIIHGMLLFCKF
jgi:hypothetical protein